MWGNLPTRQPILLKQLGQNASGNLLKAGIYIGGVILLFGISPLHSTFGRARTQVRSLTTSGVCQSASVNEAIVAKAKGTCLTTSGKKPVELRKTVTEPANESRSKETAKQIAEDSNDSTVSTASLTTGWDNRRPFLRSADGNFEVLFGGYIQFDSRGDQGGTKSGQTFLVRRARLGIEGKLRRSLDFKLQFDFSSPKSPTLRDAYVKVRLPHDANLSIGHLKANLGQEEFHSDSALDFVERSMLTNLNAYRSPGIILSGTMAKRRVAYSLGLFNGDGRFFRSKDSSPQGVIRLRFSPWRAHDTSPLKKLEFGGAYSQSLADRSGLSFRGRSESHSFTFFKPVLTNGNVTHTNAEISWLGGPASFRAEYDQSNQARRGLGAGGTNLAGVGAKGYMAQFTYVLTGETKLDSKNVVPRRDFMERTNSRRGLGAWELKMRYSNLQIDDSSPASNRAGSIYVGLNWYLNRHVRYVLDFGRERFKDPLRAPKPGAESLFVVLSRVQFAF